MKNDLKDLTFLIPLRIDSEDRLRNIKLVVSYITTHFDTNIYILESGKTQKFFPELLPGVKYVYKFDDNPIFHRTKIINDMLVDCNTKKVSCYDADVLLPINSYIESSNLLDNGYDAIYPYPITGLENGAQKAITLNASIIESFKNSNYDIEKLENNNVKILDTNLGHCFFINKSVYIESGMENENFISWGPEDQERHHRFSVLGNKIGRLENTYVYHLQHARGINSNETHQYFLENENLYNFVKKIDDKNKMLDYVNSLDYYKNRLEELK